MNPSCPHLACSPDGRVYNLSEPNPWGTLEIKCSLAESVVELQYLKEVNGALKLKKTQLLLQSEWAPASLRDYLGRLFCFFARMTIT